ncbi:MAG: exodeoxyribonuclease VII large subunit [Desulfovibrio sp.]|nr:exodeoxyribonuclease VII large subunit [Desulfovibrio sp.]
MQNAVYSVSEITAQLKQKLETTFPLIWIRGEVSGVKEMSSGHMYFTLKDAHAQLSCAWFAAHRRANYNLTTGEVYPRVTREMMEKGGEFVCCGRLSFYAQRGTCQLVVENVVCSGAGALAQAFEARKQELAQLGYFDAKRKRPIPQNPSRVALITSEQGAAIRDFLKISANRGLTSQIRLFPTLVQGKEAAAAIARAITLACSQHWAQVIVLIRGGGSLEDLWCFNEQIVADAVFQASVPVLAGIGHEVDFTLADLTADLRAATPTHAAELLWQPRAEMLRVLEEQQARLILACENFLAMLGSRLEHEERALGLASPRHKLQILQERLALCLQNFQTRWKEFVRTKEQAFLDVHNRLQRQMAPEKWDRTLARVEQLSSCLYHSLEARLAAKNRDLERLQEKLVFASERKVRAYWTELEKMQALLERASPLTLLARGYALVENLEGELVRTVDGRAAGQMIRVQLADGSLLAEITAVDGTENVSHAQEGGGAAAPGCHGTSSK